MMKEVREAEIGELLMVVGRVGVEITSFA